MIMLNVGIAAAIRIVLVLLFLPFSALDKVLNFRSAVAQAREAVPNTTVAMGLILIGLFVEVFMSLGVITGIADRACAFVLAGYCGVTALLWKQFWKPGDFWSSNSGQGRTLFWDFLKNFALGAGFLARHLWYRCGFGQPLLCPSVVLFPPLWGRTGACRAVSSDPKPAISYWHLWTDADGVSHQSRCTMTEFEKAAIAPQAAPQWIGRQDQGCRDRFHHGAAGRLDR